VNNDPNAVTETTLGEIARAICELGFRREIDELIWPNLEPETEALTNLFCERVALMGQRVDNLVCKLAAVLMLDAMVAQHMHDLRLASQSQSPFMRNEEKNK
jgi:hypothetical protein